MPEQDQAFFFNFKFIKEMDTTIFFRTNRN